MKKGKGQGNFISLIIIWTCKLIFIGILAICIYVELRKWNKEANELGYGYKRTMPRIWNLFFVNLLDGKFAKGWESIVVVICVIGLFVGGFLMANNHSLNIYYVWGWAFLCFVGIGIMLVRNALRVAKVYLKQG